MCPHKDNMKVLGLGYDAEVFGLANEGSHWPWPSFWLSLWP